jgi:hypothetical protein
MLRRHTIDLRVFEIGGRRTAFAGSPQLEEPMPEKPTTPQDDRSEHNPSPAEGEVELDPADAHIGATEGQVTETPAPSGDAFKDEPRQG